MSVYERRFCLSYGNCNHYTDDIRDAARIEAEQNVVVTVTEGYCDYEDVWPGHPAYRGIDGTIVTRRGNTLVEREQWLAMVAAAEAAEASAAA